MEQLAGKGPIVALAAIQAITDHRMAKMSKMNPDLVGPSGLDHYPQQAVTPVEFVNNLPAGGSVPTAFRLDRHLLAMNRMATDWCDQPATLFIDDTMNEGDIFFFDLAILKGIDKIAVGSITFGDHHDP